MATPLDQAFEQAAKEVHELPTTPSDAELLTLYAAYKQATVGDNNTPKPSFLDFKGSAKWNAWKKEEGMSMDAAKAKYVIIVRELKKKYGA